MEGQLQEMVGPSEQKRKVSFHWELRRSPSSLVSLAAVHARFMLTPEDRVAALFRRGPSLREGADETVGNRVTYRPESWPLLTCSLDVFSHVFTFMYRLLSRDSLHLGALGPAASGTAPVVDLKAKRNFRSALHLHWCQPDIQALSDSSLLYPHAHKSHLEMPLVLPPGLHHCKAKPPHIRAYPPVRCLCQASQTTVHGHIQPLPDFCMTHEPKMACMCEHLIIWEHRLDTSQAKCYPPKKPIPLFSLVDLYYKKITQLLLYFEFP